jgi:hypothetical protein
MQYPVHWTSLEIGYESRVSDDLGTAKPPLQKALEDLFRYAAISRWANGGHTLISAAPAIGNHKWVQEVIANEINHELFAKTKPVTIVCRANDNCLTMAVDDSSAAGIHAATVPEVPGDKDVNTRCILRGERWYNQRTYRLCVQEGDDVNPWKPCESHTASNYLIATLTWPCHPLEVDKVSEQDLAPFI